MYSLRTFLFDTSIPSINTLFLWDTQKAIKKLVLHNTLHSVWKRRTFPAFSNYFRHASFHCEAWNLCKLSYNNSFCFLFFLFMCQLHPIFSSRLGSTPSLRSFSTLGWSLGLAWPFHLSKRTHLASRGMRANALSSNLIIIVGLGLAGYRVLGPTTDLCLWSTNRRLNANVCAVINTHNTHIMQMSML